MEQKNGKNLIRDLAQLEGPCVSLYLPTFRTGTEIEQNRIRFKNALRFAEQKLNHDGYRADEREKLLQPARRMLDDHPFWENQLDGLAVFLCNSDHKVFLLPEATEELVVTAQRAHLKPLLGPLSRDERFYILTFTKERVKLYKTRRYGLDDDGQKLDLITEEQVAFKDVSQELQYHTGTPGRGGRREAVFFGGEETGKWPKKELVKEFKHISKRLQAVISDNRDPMVLVGIDYLHGFFRQALPYANVLQEGVNVNPDDLADEDLHRRASEIIDARQMDVRKEAIEQYRALAGAGSPRVSDVLEEVVRAAAYGRVESLFTAVGTQLWGSFDHETHQVLPVEEATAEHYDLLDFAALNTIDKGGRVFAVPPEEVPSKTSIAAVFRY